MYESELDAAITISKQAGVLIKKAYHSLQTSFKDTLEADLVTATDIAVQLLIQTHLSNLFPSYTFIGEESSTNDYAGFHDRGRLCWVVDPIDGTTNFVHGIPMVCTSIGLCVDGKAVLGVVYNPISDELFTAIVGQGAYYNGVLLSVRDEPFESMRGKLVATEYGVARDEAALNSKMMCVERMLKEGEVRGVRSFGSSALASCYVAKGSLDVFWEAGIHIWDICAGAVIVGETGGLLINWDNQNDGQDVDLFCRKFLIVRGVQGDIQDAVTLVKGYLGPIHLEPDFKF